MPTTTVKLPSGREIDLDDLGDLGYGPTGNVNVGHPGGWTPAYGAPYDVPDPISSAWKALGGDIDMLPSLFGMANAYNLRNYDERLSQIMGTPGWAGVMSNLGGQLPEDVVRQIAQQSAERGVGSGMTPDAPNLNAAYLSAIGRNSLQQQQLGQQQLGSLLGAFPQAAPFDMMGFLTTPDDVQAAELAARVQAAAPDPAAAAKAEQDRLLEAIAAGKAAAGGGPTVTSGGVDWQKILDALRGGSGGTDKGPGTTVGTGPRNTVDRGNNYFVPDPQDLRYTATTYKDPGASGYNAQGIRNDVIKNAAANNYVNSIFKTPGFGDAGTLGGLGLNPELNAVVGGLRPEQRANFGMYSGLGMNAAGVYPNGSYFSPGSGFGVPITSGGLSYDQNYDPWDADYMSGYSSYGFGAPIETRDLLTGGSGSSWLSNNVFSTPAYEYSGSLGGLAIDPVTAAILGPGGVIGMGSMFDPGNMVNLTPADYAKFGQSLFPSDFGNFGFGSGGGNMATEAELAELFGFD